MMRNFVVSGTIALLLGAMPLAQAADLEAGKAKAQPCQACHGADGNTPLDATYPKLAGQHASYLEKSLKDYRSGARANAIMAGFATTLTDEDIKNISAYYASLPGDLHDLSHHE